MASDLRSLLETVDDALLAYKARIRELEGIVQAQQQIIEELRSPDPGEPQHREGNAQK